MMRVPFLKLPAGLAGLAGLAVPGAALAQNLGGGASPEVSIVRTVGALILCLILAFLAILFLKRKGGGALPPMLRGLVTANPEIEVREVRRLSVQHHAALIRHRNEEYLVLLSPGDSLLLSQRKTDDAPPGAAE